MRIGVIDIGSNSTRLLIADVGADGIEEVERDSIVTRLADGVDTSGRLSAEAVGRVREALEQYAARIDAADCQRRGAIATSAMRDAADGDAAAEQLSRAIDTEISVIEGEREARLSFRGASSGDALSPDEQTLVVDIGGGSTEFIVGRDGNPVFHTSTQLGAVRQSERHLAHDPPTDAELEALAAEARAVVEQAVPKALRSSTVRAVAVAGTPTVLASVDQALEVFDPWKVHGYAITSAACLAMFRRLAALPLAERRLVTGLHPDRAPTIVAGAAILSATLAAFELPEAIVSEHDILYGLALQLAED